MLPDLLSPFTFGRWSGTAEDSIKTKGSFICLLSSSPLQGEGCSSLYGGEITGFLICGCLGTVTALMGIARLFFHSCIILLWAWFLVWVSWSWKPLTGQMVSKHSGHLMVDSLMREVDMSVFTSPYPPAIFMNLIKGFFDYYFFFLTFVACCSKEPYQV